jgi:hypothetical protein
MLAESTRIEHDLGDVVWIANNLGRMAYTVALEGDAAAAVRLLAAAEARHEHVGVSPAKWVAEMNEETLTIIRTQLDQAAFAEAWDQGRKLTVDEAVTLALGEGD